MVVAPAPPARAILRKAEVMDEVERTRVAREQALELGLVGLERRRRLVEAADQAGALERLDLGSVVERGREDLAARLDQLRERAIERVAGAREQAHVRLRERERQLVRSAPHPHAGR